MRTLGAVVTNWNMAWCIRQNLEMLLPVVDKIAVVQSIRPINLYKTEHAYKDKPDESEGMIRTLFPDIPIYPYEPEDDDEFLVAGRMWNFGMDKLRDLDMVLKLDCDHYFTPGDMLTFASYVRQSEAENIALDWSTHSINYYLDLDHGLKDQVETDPLAINPKKPLGRLLDYPEPRTVVDMPVMLHHLRNVKKPWVTKDWIDGKVPSPWGVFSTQLLDRFGDHGGWYRASDEVRRVFP